MSMTVETAVEQIISDLMEADASGPFSTTAIIDKLNEALRHLRNLVIQRDPSGEWFGDEASANYPANVRYTAWAGAGKWGAAGSAMPTRFYSARAIIPGDIWPRVAEIIEVQEEVDWCQTHNDQQYAVIIRGDYIGLRKGGSIDPPTSDTPLRFSYVRPFTPINRASVSYGTEKIKVIGGTATGDFPFPADHVEAIVAYATVLLVGKTEASANQWVARYNQLEDDLIQTVSRRRQRQSQPSVRMHPDSRHLWRINGG